MVEPLERAAADAYWEANTQSNDATEAAAARAQKAVTRVWSDRALFDELQSHSTEAMQSPDDARQYALLHTAFLANQMDAAVLEEMIDTEVRVESVFNTFRASLRGVPTAENALREALRQSDDADLRRDVWEASKTIGPVVEADVLRLVALRNGEARNLGYSDFYHFSLALQEMSVEQLFMILGDVEAATEEPFRVYKAGLDRQLAERFGIGVEELRAHHFGDPFFQEAPTGEIDLDRFFAGRDLPPIAVAFFDAIGLDVRDVLKRSDLYERPAKNQHAFATHVGRYEDVRILCNCTPTEQWMGTLLHELGHAVYDKYLGDDLPFFLRDVSHILTTEAIAMLLGRFSRNAAWLVRYAGVVEEEATALAASAEREQAAQLLIMARWCLVMAHFERALYADPTQDLNALWWTLVKRFQHIMPPEGRPSRADWAAKIHLATAPVYYHNYQLGEMFASQLLDYLHAHIGSADSGLVANPAVGDYLKRRVFAPGARLRWDALIETATGEPLNTAHFIAHLQSAL